MSENASGPEHRADTSPVATQEPAPIDSRKAWAAGIITVAGALVTAALQVFTDGPVSGALTILAAGITAAGTVLGVQRIANRPLR